ncbi:MAG: YaeQ family protein [Candidatus Omnitrophica bacterium]|nr:YaeQ family protein [Candidatus Omnitrophota bacterium]
MIEKFTFDLQSHQVRKKLVLVKSELELRTHVVLKLLAYLLFYDPRLQIETSVDMHYKPDLVIPGESGIPELWIDCGKIALRKVEKISTKLRASRIVIVKETHGELERFKKLIDKKVDAAFRLEYLAFDHDFISGIADSLQRTNELTLYTVMENVIGIALNDQVFESFLYR